MFRLPSQAARADDTGMTLIEVVIAISLIAVIATAAIGLSITGETSSKAQQRQEVAVSVANEAMERVIAESPVALYDGRTEAAVTQSWNENGEASGIDATFMAWDRSPSASKPLLLAPKTTVTRNGTIYTVYTLIGTCKRTVGSNDFCTKSIGSPPTFSEMNRVMVVVKWSAGALCAGPKPCSYQATSLIDASPDLDWNLNG
ncbi:type IV pilus modification PilV family protein [Glaciibacter psychrotolerans]|nr:type II secretion system protein [Leifsonia psychrotolerans]